MEAFFNCLFIFSVVAYNVVNELRVTAHSKKINEIIYRINRERGPL